jgi:hypothetical protein
VVQVKNTESRQKGLTPQERLDNWEIDARLLLPRPAHIVVFDDLLTGGSHFAAMKMGFARQLPGVPVSGIFLARRVVPDTLMALAG